MELVREAQSVWGQTELVGASWEPLWVFVAAGLALVLIHALYAVLAGAKRARHSDGA